MDRNESAEGSGWDDEDTETVVPWLICFLVGLVVVWLIWFFRHRIMKVFSETINPPVRALSYVIPARPHPGVPGAPGPLPPFPSATLCTPPPPPPKPEPAQELIHWQWVSTGKPPTPLPEFRGRSKAIVGSNFHARPYSLHSDNMWSRGSANASIDSVRFSIGGYETPSYCSNVNSLSIPSHSLQSQKSCFPKMSSRKFKILLSRIYGITDPEVKREILDLTFDIIQLGDWTDRDWRQFVQKLFSDKIGGNKYVIDLQDDLKSKDRKFSDIVRIMLQCWLTVNGIDKADIRKLYEALECCDKLDIAHNAAINVVLALRRKQGKAESDCTDPFSDYEETPNTSLENSMPSRSDSNFKSHNTAERALVVRNAQKVKCVRHTHHPRVRLNSMNSGDANPSHLLANLSLKT